MLRLMIAVDLFGVFLMPSAPIIACRTLISEGARRYAWANGKHSRPQRQFADLPHADLPHIRNLSGQSKAPKPHSQARRTRPRIDDAQVLAGIKQIGVILNGICGKRFAAILPEVISVLEHHHTY